jgi:5-formyltetrahydrofolate cyclo-ligase
MRRGERDQARRSGAPPRREPRDERARRRPQPLRSFAAKADARQAVWDALQEAGVARFPFPPHGRIPNFRGAEQAAERLLDDPLFAKAKRIKVNPDAPQRPLRAAALARGIVVYVPTPRLRGGFRRFDPAKIPTNKIADAASLSRGSRWGEAVALRDLPRLDAIVAGSVAVTRDGRRCGKGEGYSDLEFAILRELGHPAVPVATTIHPLQLVGGFPRASNDLPLTLIVLPDETIRVRRLQPAPTGIEWERLTEEDLDAMPVLRELRRLKHH